MQLFIIITGIGSKRIEQTMMRGHLLEKLEAAFLTDIARTNRSPHTRHAYETDLTQLCAFYQGPVNAMRAEALQSCFRAHLHLRPAMRAREQAAAARFLSSSHQREALGSRGTGMATTAAASI